MPEISLPCKLCVWYLFPVLWLMSWVKEGSTFIPSFLFLSLSHYSCNQSVKVPWSDSTTAGKLCKRHLNQPEFCLGVCIISLLLTDFVTWHTIRTDFDSSLAVSWGSQRCSFLSIPYTSPLRMSLWHFCIWLSWSLSNYMGFSDKDIPLQYNLNSGVSKSSSFSVFFHEISFDDNF